MPTTTIEKPISTKTLKNRKIREKQTKKRQEVKIEREEKIRILNAERDVLAARNESLEKECSKITLEKEELRKTLLAVEVKVLDLEYKLSIQEGELILNSDSDM